MTSAEVASNPTAVDKEAEWAVVAIATASPADAREIGKRLDIDELYYPTLARGLDAALQLEDIRGLFRRIALVSRLAQLPEPILTEEALCCVGPISRWTDRVRAMARRRRAQALSAVLYNQPRLVSLEGLVPLVDELLDELRKLQSEGRAMAEVADDGARWLPIDDSRGHLGDGLPRAKALAASIYRSAGTATPGQLMSLAEEIGAQLRKLRGQS